MAIKRFTLFLILLFTACSTVAMDQDKEKFYAEVRQVCSLDIPESQPQCDALIEQLSKDGSVKSLLLLTSAKESIALRTMDAQLKKAMEIELDTLYQKILDKDPTITTAMMALALSKPRKEQIATLKEILTLEPHHVEVLQILSTVLSHGTPEEHIEGIEILLKGYPGIKNDNSRHRLGVLFLELVKSNPKRIPQQIIAARKHVLNNIGVKFNLPDYASAIKSIGANCSYFTMQLNAKQACFDGLKRIMDNGVRYPQQLVIDTPVVLSSLTTLLPNKYELQEKTPNRDVQLILRDWFEDIKATGENSLVFHLAYSQVLTGHRKIATLRNAAAVERKLPDFKGPGQAAHWLASALAKAGFDDEAALIAIDLKANGVEPYRSMARSIGRNNNVERIIIQ